MTNLTPERLAELRTDAENRRLFRFVTSIASDGYPSSGFQPIDADISALLDAADERDQLLTVVHEADQLHVAALAAEGELLGDSPEMPRWERLLLNGLTLPELAKNVADERDQMAAAVERVRALHVPYTTGVLTGDCAAEACDHEDECPTQKFEYCAGCHEIAEGADAYYMERNARLTAYPCATIRALGDRDE